MITLGKFNKLKVISQDHLGFILNDDENVAVFLPKMEAPADIKIDDEISVFVYSDADHDFIATTREPFIQLNEFGCLRVKSVNDFGAFLDWGIPKDLFLPYAEQRSKMSASQRHIVYLYFDEKSGRLAASAKIHKFINPNPTDIKIGQEVELLIGDRSDLGQSVIVNNQYKGLVFENEIFKFTRKGDKTKGFVKFIREDGKLDILLEPIGFAKIEGSEQVILDYLKKHNGFAEFNDESDPDDIKYEFQMSKKSFKKAIGILFKKRLIKIEKDGIHLVQP